MGKFLMQQVIEFSFPVVQQANQDVDLFGQAA
jgi:hypothetical protein